MPSFENVETAGFEERPNEAESFAAPAFADLETATEAVEIQEADEPYTIPATGDAPSAGLSAAAPQVPAFNFEPEDPVTSGDKFATEEDEGSSAAWDVSKSSQIAEMPESFSEAVSADFTPNSNFEDASFATETFQELSADSPPQAEAFSMESNPGSAFTPAFGPKEPQTEESQRPKSFWSNLGNDQAPDGSQVPVSPETSGEFLDTVGDQLYPENPTFDEPVPSDLFGDFAFDSSTPAASENSLGELLHSSPEPGMDPFSFDASEDELSEPSTLELGWDLSEALSEPSRVQAGTQEPAQPHGLGNTGFSFDEESFAPESTGFEPASTASWSGPAEASDIDVEQASHLLEQALEADFMSPGPEMDVTAPAGFDLHSLMKDNFSAASDFRLDETQPFDVTAESPEVWTEESTGDTLRPETLDVLYAEQVSDDTVLYLVQVLDMTEQPVYALMGLSEVSGEDVSVIKIFHVNPLALEDTFSASRQGRALGKDMFLVQAGTWQGVVSDESGLMSLEAEWHK